MGIVFARSRNRQSRGVRDVRATKAEEQIVQPHELS